jgi:uncharacterized protein (DUF2249 family)
LIGFATLSSVQGSEKELCVDPKRINYGYVTRNPVKYEWETTNEGKDGKKVVLLEQNHSHFILVKKY